MSSEHHVELSFDYYGGNEDRIEDEAKRRLDAYYGSKAYLYNVEVEHDGGSGPHRVTVKSRRFAP